MHAFREELLQASNAFVGLTLSIGGSFARIHISQCAILIFCVVSSASAASLKQTVV